MELFYFIIILILLLSLMAIFYVSTYNNLKDKLLKKREVESEIDETLRNKYDELIKIKILLNNTLKGKDASNLDTLTKLEKLPDEKLTSFEFYRSLIDYENKILKIKENAKKIMNPNEIEEGIEKIEDYNIRLNGEIRYYNDAISNYMRIFSKFPGSVVAKFSKLKEERYFDNRNLDDNYEKDFKI